MTKTPGVITHVIFLWMVLMVLPRFPACAPPLCCFATLVGRLSPAVGAKSWQGARTGAAWPFVVWLEKRKFILSMSSTLFKAYERGGDICERAVAGQQNIPCFPASALGKRDGFCVSSGHTILQRAGRFRRGSVMRPRRRTSPSRFCVSLGNRRNGQPFASGECTGREI